MRDVLQKCAAPRVWLAAWMVAICVASSVPGDGMPQECFVGESYVRHLGAFAVGGVLAGRVFSTPGMALVVLGVFAAGDEWHQTFTPGRQADVWDWAADVVGAGIGLALLRGWRGRNARPTTPGA